MRTSGSGRPIISQSILTLDPSMDSRAFKGCVTAGAAPAKSPSVGGASRTVSLQEARTSPKQLVIITVKVPESSGNARLISNVVEVAVLRIYKRTRQSYYNKLPPHPRLLGRYSQADIETIDDTQ